MQQAPWSGDKNLVKWQVPNNFVHILMEYPPIKVTLPVNNNLAHIFLNILKIYIFYFWHTIIIVNQYTRKKNYNLTKKKNNNQKQS